MDCHTCGLKFAVMKRCVQCKAVFYCSKQCQINDWPLHQKKCQTAEDQEKERNTTPLLPSSPQKAVVTICVKCNHKKHKITVSESPADAMATISDTLRVPLSKLKLIGLGKVTNEQNFTETVFAKKCRSFLAFGEECEDETGLETKDIETIMKQLAVERNTAVRGLRECKGDVIDAILHIANSS